MATIEQSHFDRLKSLKARNQIFAKRIKEVFPEDDGLAYKIILCNEILAIRLHSLDLDEDGIKYFFWKYLLEKILKMLQLSSEITDEEYENSMKKITPYDRRTKKSNDKLYRKFIRLFSEREKDIAKVLYDQFEAAFEGATGSNESR